MKGAREWSVAVLLAAIAVLAFRTQNARSEEPSPPSNGAAEALPWEMFQELIRQSILDELKPQYEDTKNWGHQTKMLSGIKVRGKWFEPRIETRTRGVNEGIWQRYVVSPIEPEKNLHVRLEHVDSPHQGRTAFALLAEAKLHGEAQIKRWRYGLKTIDLRADGDLIVEARVTCDVGVNFETGKAGAIALDPRVTAVDLRLIDVDMKRIGPLGRDIAREIGDSLTPLFRRELDRREARIVEKANAAIDKRRDRLRLSLGSLVPAGWPQLPAAPVGEEKPAQN